MLQERSAEHATDDVAREMFGAGGGGSPPSLLDAMLKEALLETGRSGHSWRRVTEAQKIAWVKLTTPSSQQVLWYHELIGIETISARLRARIDGLSRAMDRKSGEDAKHDLSHQLSGAFSSASVKRESASGRRHVNLGTQGCGASPASLGVPAVMRGALIAFEGRRFGSLTIQGRSWWLCTSEELATAAETHASNSRFLDAIRRFAADPRKTVGEQIILSDLETAERIAESANA